MIYSLLIGWMVLGLLSYCLCGRDPFAPGTMLTWMGLFSCACAIYNLPLWQFELSALTVWVLLSTMGISVLINAGVHSCFRRVRVERKAAVGTPIRMGVSLAVLALLAGVILVMLAQIRRVAGGGTFASVMVLFRTKNAYGTDLSNQLPGWVRQMLNLSAVMCFLYLFNFIKFGRQLKKLDAALNLAVIALSIFTSLLTGGRFSAMTMLVGAVVMWYMIRMEGRRTLGVKAVFRIMLVVLAALYGFYAVKSFVGRQSDATAVEYITHYAGGGIPGLDLYLKDPPHASPIWGKETFYSLNNGLRKLGLLDIPYYYIHHEFRQSGGVSIGNIYTALRDYHYDFGMAGVYLLHGVFSVVFSVFYEYQKKRRSDLGIIVFSMMYYCVVFYMISNSFFASVVSFGFAIRLTLLYLLYTLLIKKRVGVQSHE